MCSGGCRILQGHHSAADGSHLLGSVHREVEPAQTHRPAHGDDRRSKAGHVSIPHTNGRIEHSTEIKAFVGFSSSIRLVLGFMCCTVFLSMWLSNTSTTAMVMPIAEAVLQQLICTGLADGHEDSETMDAPEEDSGTSTLWTLNRL